MMKYLLMSLLVLIGIVSCQKEITDEVEVSLSSAAVFSLQGSPDSCITPTIQGYYAATTPLTDSNTVTISVNVASPGTYTITTDTVNGYQFIDSGIFVKAGIQTVLLKGKGTPLVVKTDTFTPISALSGSVGCSFKIKVVAPTPAVYTLSGAPDTCTVATVNGLYGINTPLSSANTVGVQVNVTSIGSYNLSTDTVAGISFSKAGIFTSTGLQTITLIGKGTPDSAGNKVFRIGTAGCTFPILIFGPSVYTFSGAPGACTSAIVQGVYIKGTPLSAPDSVTVQVNVTTAGSYTITTNTVNGFSFSGSGIFKSTGIQKVALPGNGTPTTAGANVFIVGTAGCSFSVPVVGPAVYTLSGGSGACTVATVNGTYSQGNALDTSNKVTVQVNVTTIGAYTISTNTVGGMTFTKTGIFTSLGIQNVVLSGTGIPTTAGVNAFTVGTGGCTFNVTVAAPSGIYSCKVDGVFISFSNRAKADVTDNSTTPPTPRLYLDGFSGPGNGGNVPELQIFVDKNNGSAVAPGSYNVDGYLLPDGYRIEIDYHVVNADSSVTIWNTSSSTISTNPPFTIVVGSINATRVTGTFSGTLTNTTQGSTMTKTVTEGTFDLPIF